MLAKKGASFNHVCFLQRTIIIYKNIRISQLDEGISTVTPFQTKTPIYF